MTESTVLIVLTMALAVTWLPIVIKFQRAWMDRKNPVSLAICAAALLFAYDNAIYSLAVMGETTWHFYAVATRCLEIIIVINFYISFRWSNVKFAGGRRTDGSLSAP